MVVLITSSFVLVISQTYCQTSDDSLTQIVILSNGNVTPSDAPISRNGNLYELTGDINAELVVLRNNVIIDGNGYAITGTDKSVGKGVYLNDLTNVAIRNLKVSNFLHAISIDGCSFVVVEDNYL